MPANHGYDYLVKVLVVGTSAVGKSCILQRFVDNTFTTSFITTIGIDFKIKTIVMDGLTVKLQVWDTAGQERFRTITNSYYRGAAGVLLVYDVTEPSTFTNIQYWLRNVEQHSVNCVNRVLVGNKCDLVDERMVTTAEGEAYAVEHKMKFYETSAKTGVNINEAFTQLAMDCVKTVREAQIESTAPITQAKAFNFKLLGSSTVDSSSSNSRCCS